MRKLVFAMALAVAMLLAARNASAYCVADAVACPTAGTQHCCAAGTPGSVPACGEVNAGGVDVIGGCSDTPPAGGPAGCIGPADPNNPGCMDAKAAVDACTACGCDECR